MKKGGFTLIELLVVIAIIAILAAILFPVFARAREKARQTSCLSNVKQLVLACLMYADDYDETLPHSGRFTGRYSWRVRILPYVKNRQVFVCPTRPERNAFLSWDGVTPDDGVDALNPCGYGINVAHGVQGSTIAPPAGSALAEIAEPSQTMLLADDGDWRFTSGSITHGVTIAKQDATDRHNDGANQGYVDGHAKWLPWSKQFCTDATDCMWDTE